MRILFISDVHANPWALNAVLADAGTVDHVLCAGDLVNYGPAPVETLEIVRALHATIAQGNHDAAVGLGIDPRASTSKQTIALAMRDWTRKQLGPNDLTWLANLSHGAAWSGGNTLFRLVHATPPDALYDYRLTPQANDFLAHELTCDVEADVLVVGHTHLPFIRRIGVLTIVNPGSVGQPLDGDPRASYALWEDGRCRIIRADYDRSKALVALELVPLKPEMTTDLKNILLSGRI